VSRPDRPARRLPDFPWDSLDAARAAATAHPGGLIDLSVGTPVDPVPSVVREALTQAADSPGYPATIGTGPLRAAAVDWMRRRLGVTGVEPDQVVPVIGSKEAVAWLPTMLGLGAGDVVAVPELAYPTYAVGATLAGAQVVATDSPDQLPAPPALVWVNSPANPTGAVTDPARLAGLVDWARRYDVVLASDECYIELGWDARPRSLLHPQVARGSAEGLLVLHSLSKRSSMAGYRAGFLTGDRALVAELLEVRRHAGMMVPAPVQAAMTAALRDDAHVEVTRATYAARRATLVRAVEAAGFRVDHSQAGLYLWVTNGQSADDTVMWLARRGVLAAPGTFYGPAGARHVRLALTAPDAQIAAVASRLC
jgi:succinyldiaminopimelate transaminase